VRVDAYTEYIKELLYMVKSAYKTFKSFIPATQGIFCGFQERNMRVHGLALALVLFLGIFFQITLLEWILVTIVSGLVITAELINTAFEEICNILRDDLGMSYSSTRKARDMAAGAVLVMAIVAAVIGGIIFFPRMWILISVLRY